MRNSAFWPTIVTAAIAAIAQPVFAQDAGSSVEERRPIPWHSPDMYEPGRIVDTDAGLSTHGGVDSGATPGAYGPVAPVGPPGKMIWITPPQLPAASARPPVQVPQQPGERFNYLRPQPQLPEYRLEQGNPAHAAILKAQAAGDLGGAVSAAQQLSAQGDIAASRFLAGQHQYGSKGYDFAQWVHWIDRAAQQGDVASQYEMGRLYAAGVPAGVGGTGQGLAVDPRKAIGYLQMCWRASNDCAYGLGVMTLQEGLPMAAVYMRHAAGAAHPKAMMWLGKALVDGAHGQPRDPVMGAVWLKLAGASGVQEANSLYAEVYQGLSAPQRGSVDVSAQQLQERFSKGGAVRKRVSKRREPDSLIDVLLAALFDQKVAKPLNQRFGATGQSGQAR